MIQNSKPQGCQRYREMHRAELLWTLLFSLCKVSGWKWFKQGVALWPLWIISLLWEYFQFLSNLSIKKLILVIHVRFFGYSLSWRCCENIPGIIQGCQSLYMAPSQGSCHSSSFIIGTFCSLRGVPRRSQSILVWVSFLRLSMAELAWNLDYLIQEGYTWQQDYSHRLPKSILSGHPGYCHCPGKEKETLHVSYLDSFIFLSV